MTDEQHDRAPDDTQPTGYCTTKPRVGDRITDKCVDCGHATLIHVGVEHCPVCELVHHNANARAAAMTITVVAEPTSLAERAWADVQTRHARALKHVRSTRPTVGVRNDR